MIGAYRRKDTININQSALVLQTNMVLWPTLSALHTKEYDMGLDGCRKCWDTPCECGWEYRYWSLERRQEMAAVVLGVKLERVKIIPAPVDHPQKDKLTSNKRDKK